MAGWSMKYNIFTAVSSNTNIIVCVLSKVIEYSIFT